jgi:hypothetical protein
VVAFLLVTNRWKAPHVWGNDAESYSLMSAAAPHLPSGGVGSAYAGRLLPHYAVGLLSDVTGFDLHTTYWIAGIAVTLALALIAAELLRALDAPWIVAALVLAAFIAGPYASPRETLVAPGLLQDEVFVLGLALLVLGLVRTRFPVVLAGALVALAGRQTALLVLPVAALWILVDPQWATVARSGRRVRAAVVVITGIALYGVILTIVASFDYPFGPDSASDTIIFSPPSLHDLVAHVGRCAIPFVVPGAVLLAVLGVLWRAGFGPRAWPLRLGLLLTLSAAIVVQPLLITPEYPGFSSNEQRLAGIGLLPLWLAAALMVGQAVRQGLLRPAGGWLAVAAVAVVVASLSHVYTTVGPSSLSQFLVLQVLAAAALVVVVLAAARGADGESADGESARGAIAGVQPASTAA